MADALTTTSSLWTFAISDVNTGGHGLPFEQLDAVHHIRNDHYQPYTISSRANDTIEGLNDERPIAFPIPPGVLPQNLPEQQMNNSLLSYPAFPFSDVTRAEILKTAGPIWENRLRWIELPRDPFKESAIGAVVLLPMQNPRPEDSQQQEILVCNLGAGWGPSTLNTSTYEYGSGNVNSEISSQVCCTRNPVLSQQGVSATYISG